MSIHLLGQQSGSTAPFSRSFFRSHLDTMLDRISGGKSVQVVLFLTDGTTLETCSIDDLEDDFVVVRGYHNREESSTCTLSVHLIPYGLIYRIEVGPKTGDESRMGFHRGTRGVR